MAVGQRRRPRVLRRVLAVAGLEGGDLLALLLHHRRHAGIGLAAAMLLRHHPLRFPVQPHDLRLQHRPEGAHRLLGAELHHRPLRGIDHPQQVGRTGQGIEPVHARQHVQVRPRLGGDDGHVGGEHHRPQPQVRRVPLLLQQLHQAVAVVLQQGVDRRQLAAGDAGIALQQLRIEAAPAAVLVLQVQLLGEIGEVLLEKADAHRAADHVVLHHHVGAEETLHEARTEHRFQRLLPPRQPARFGLCIGERGRHAQVLAHGLSARKGVDRL